MKFSPWTRSLLPATVRFWNRVFAGRRNFVPLTEQRFLERVVEKRTTTERFDPQRFIVARDGAEMAGFVHLGVRPEALCRKLDAEWRGGTQGYVAFLFVDPARRRKGLGTELWHRGLQSLKGSRQVVVDGQCLNPFYGNSEGPLTPFWGTPDGVGVEWDDSATKKFLARKGFAPRFKATQLGLDLRVPGGSLEDAIKGAGRQGYSIEFLGGRYPVLGRPLRERRRVPPGLTYEVTVAVRRGRVAGLLGYYPMEEVRPGLVGIYEAAVRPELQGHALGRRLLQAALARMRLQGAGSVEVLTIPELSPAATQVYRTAGFLPLQSWAIY